MTKVIIVMGVTTCLLWVGIRTADRIDKWIFENDKENEIWKD